MSWVDKIKTDFIITTGDGERYTPNWLNASFQTEYNLTEFNFIGVAGSLVKQEQPIGIKYSLEIYFQGADHIDTAKKFQVSCNDKRPWVVEHPLFDILNVKCSSLNFDYSNYNVTKITGTMIETIIDGRQPITVSPLDQIPILYEQANVDLELSLNEIPGSTDINTLTTDNEAAYKRGLPIISLTEDFEKFTNGFNTALTYINTATATPLLMMRSVMNVISLPGEFAASVKSRIDVLRATQLALRAGLLGLLNRVSKLLFQNKSGAAVAGMCLASVNPITAATLFNQEAVRPPNDYDTVDSVLDIIDIIVTARNEFIADLDTIQSPNGGNVNSFVPDAQALISLNELVNTTISALFELSLSARSERSIICEKDTDWITLTHRLYGLDISDANIEDLMNQNKPGLEEYLIVPKDRKIIYYV